MRFEIIFDYFDDVVMEEGIVDRVVRNDYMIVEAETFTLAKRDFLKFCSGIIRSIKEVKQ